MKLNTRLKKFKSQQKGLPKERQIKMIDQNKGRKGRPKKKTNKVNLSRIFSFSIKSKEARYFALVGQYL